MPMLFLDTGMAGTGLALPMSTSRAANVEVLVDAEGIGYGVQNTLSATPIVCRSARLPYRRPARRRVYWQRAAADRLRGYAGVGRRVGPQGRQEVSAR